MPRLLARLLLAVSFLLLADGTASHRLSSGPHIADVNILLPPRMTHPVEYLLQGSDGCFKWTWDHHDILAVLPEYNSTSHCSTSARLRSIAPYRGRKETAVYATDSNTGIVIRCKVFIDNISKIRIFHSSVKLDLDGLATLRVGAFDDEDNKFSSLVGIQFMWQLLSETDTLPHHLVHVPLKDSPLSDCGGLCGDLNVQVELEESGVFSDLFVVKGIGIGHEKVSVHLLEPGFKHMADMILVTVAEAMSLEPPSPVFVLVGAVLQYNLKVIRGNLPQVVALPSAHHWWSVTNSSIAEVDSMMGFTHALSIGETAVIVEDTRVTGNIQVSSLNVVLPESLYLYISPLSISGDPMEGMEAVSSAAPWYVVSGRRYLIQMKVFSHGPGAQEIYITESDDLQLHNTNTDYWETYLPSDNMVAKHGLRSSRILIATLQGMGRLTASLTYFCGQEKKNKVLKVVQEVIICDPVKFFLDKTSDTSKIILLPWAPAIYQEVTLKATGGCGQTSSDYKWFASDMSTLLISASGVVQARKPGKVTVKAVSVFDPLNFDEVVIEVTVPSSMLMLRHFPVETVVGSHIQAAVTMKASNGAPFYRCDAFHPFIKWMTGNEFFIVINSTEKPFVPERLGSDVIHLPFYGPPCSWTRLYASGSGQTMLQATLSKDYHHVDHLFTGPMVLKASLAIAAYPPLTVHQVGDGNQFGGYWFDLAHVEASNEMENLEKVFLAPRTTIDVMLFGGPQPWGTEVDFIESFEILDDKNASITDGVVVKPVSDSYRSVYRVLCSTLGTFNLVFKRRNLVGDNHPLPAIAEVTLALACRFPSSIALMVDEPANKLEVIRMAILAGYSIGHVRATPVTVANGRTIHTGAVGIDISGNAFANSSSLSLKWELTGCEGLAFWDDAFESRMHKSSWERFLSLQNESGECIIRATVTGFSETMGTRYDAHLQSLENVLMDAIRIQIVSALRVNPEFTLLFFHPNAKANLSITGGSCFLEAAVNDSQVLEIMRTPPSLQCSQLTLSPKELGTAVVTVYDIGLAPPIAASATVQVADVDWIRIVSGDEINLMEGQSKSIDLIAGTNYGSTFDSCQFAYMKVHVYIEDHIVDLEENENILSPGAQYLCAANFKIFAKHLGITTIYVSAMQLSGHEIISQSVKVEVYAPLRIHPCDIFLVPGASYMLTVKGGPTVGAFVDYASVDEEIAIVDGATGKLSAISPGNTTVLSRVYGNGGAVICETFGTVEVGIPALAKLNVQSEQLDVGREMPIYPMFAEGGLFSFYEVCKSYKWTIEDEKVMSFYEADGLHGEKHWSILDTEKDLGFFQILHGRSAGRTKVAVTFSCDFVSASYSQSRFYNASLSLLVVPGLPLALGVPMTWVLPPHYTTSSLLPSLLESQDEHDVQNRRGTILYSVLRTCGEKKEVWQHDAISIDGDRIKTSESSDLACIQAKDRVTGRIEIASCVRVAEVAQIRITKKDFPHHLTYLAVGAQIDLPISYFDALGNPFHEAHNIVNYDIETNYPDIIAVDFTRNSSNILHLKGKRHGQALLRVLMNGNPEKSDYVLISVGAHIYPQNPVLHQGSSLNFVVEGMSDQVSGRWYSANEIVISVHMLSGKADVVGVGSTQVLFECPSTQLRTAVTVLPGSIVSVVAPKELLTNVPYPVKGYSFPVKFSDSYNKFEDVAKGNEFLFDCKVVPDFVGYVKPQKDLTTGNLYCLFFPYSPEHLGHSLSKSKDMKPYLSISITALLIDANHISGSTSSLFIGGFSIMENGQSVEQLHLTPNSNKTIITIMGNTGSSCANMFDLIAYIDNAFSSYYVSADVTIQWYERDLLSVMPIDSEGFSIGGRSRYEVKVVEDRRLKDKIVIMLPATGQKVEIEVNYEPGERSAPKALLGETFWLRAFFTLVILVLATVTVVGILELYKRPRRRASAPTTTAPFTPLRGKSPALSELSPRTPQPFVEYVRKTIDETPYYRREARSRFNPQNTY